MDILSLQKTHPSYAHSKTELFMMTLMRVKKEINFVVAEYSQDRAHQMVFFWKQDGKELITCHAWPYRACISKIDIIFQFAKHTFICFSETRHDGPY